MSFSQILRLQWRAPLPRPTVQPQATLMNDLETTDESMLARCLDEFNRNKTLPFDVTRDTTAQCLGRNTSKANDQQQKQTSHQTDVVRAICQKQKMTIKTICYARPSAGLGTSLELTLKGPPAPPRSEHFPCFADCAKSPYAPTALPVRLWLRRVQRW